jgi:antitoxin (DNA-binding transcriptional repressor) of toxin-antitoxin stability system
MTRRKLGSMSKTPRQIGAADFKMHCLQVLDDLPPEGLVITKRGKQVALVTPIRARTLDLFGILKGKLQVHGDIVDTTDLAASDEWSADEENLRPPVTRRKGRRT